MTKIQLKSKLIEKIELLEDVALIEEILGLVSIETEKSYQFNEQQTQKIKNSQEQIKNGEYLTDEEVNKEIDEWLEK